MGSFLAFLRAAVRKDVLRRLHDPAGLAVWLGIPIVLGTLILLISGGGSGGGLRAQVLVVDQDDTFASRLLRGVFQQGPAEGLFEAREVELDAGRAQMEEGAASALVVIPEGFSRALFRDEPTTLQLVTNPAQRIAPGLVEETLRMVGELAFYGQRVLGAQVRAIQGMVDEDRDPTDAEVAAISVAISATMQRVGELAFPPVLKLATAPLDPDPAPEQEGPPLALVILPGIVLMSLLFIAQGTSEDLWEERERGTLRRAASAPVALSTWLLAKVLSGAVVMGAIAAVAGLVAVLGIGLDPLRALSGAAWATLSAAAFGVLMLLLHSLAGSRRGGSTLGMLVLFPLLMLGGSFFPFEVMPEGLARVGRLTPNGMALVQLRHLLEGTASASGLAGTAALLLGSAALVFLLLVARVRRAFVGA